MSSTPKHCHRAVTERVTDPVTVGVSPRRQVAHYACLPNLQDVTIQLVKDVGEE